jgi:WD40 repeat protein
MPGPPSPVVATLLPTPTHAAISEQTASRLTPTFRLGFGPILDVALSSDGQEVTVFTTFDVLRYAVDDLTLVERLSVAPQWLEALFSPDGSVALVRGVEGDSALVDVRSGGLVAEVPGDWTVGDFADDGRHLALGLGDGRALVLDTADGEIHQEVRAAFNWLVNVALGASGTRLATVDGTDILSVFDLETEGEILRVVDVAPSRLLFTSDGRYFVAADYVWVWVWDLETGQTLWSFGVGPGGESIQGVWLDEAQGSVVVGYGREGTTLESRDLRTGTIQSTESVSESIRLRAAQPGAERTVESDGSSFWVREGPPGASESRGWLPYLGSCMAVSSLGPTLVTDGGLWSLTSGAEMRAWAGSCPLLLSHDGSTVVMPGLEGDLAVYSVLRASEPSWLPCTNACQRAREGGVPGFAVSPTGRLAAVHDGRAVNVYNVETGEVEASFPAYGDYAALAFNANETRLGVIAGGTLRIWDLATLGPVSEDIPIGSADWVWASLDLRTWLVGDAQADGLVFWDAGNGTWILWREGTGNTVLASDGRLAATVVDDRLLELWGRTEAGEMQLLAQYTVPSYIMDVALSPDERWLATMRYDGVAWIWGVTP